MKVNNLSLLIILITWVLTVGCGLSELENVATDTPAPTSTSTPTSRPRPTDTPAPTNTSKPTTTPIPTSTPQPTDTPEPTSTPRPTSAPAPQPPTATRPAAAPPASSNGTIYLESRTSENATCRISVWGNVEFLLDAGPGNPASRQAPPGDYGWQVFFGPSGQTSALAMSLRPGGTCSFVCYDEYVEWGCTP